MTFSEEAVVRFRCRVRPSEGCWEWTGWKDAEGYGVICIGGRNWRAHRVALILSGVDLPPGSVGCHRCDNPGCCNPAHLFVGTVGENNADRSIKGRSATGDHAGLRRHPERAARGERNGRAKLTAEQVDDIRKRVTIGATYRGLAREFRVTHRLIRLIVERKIWRNPLIEYPTPRQVVAGPVLFLER
jgi:HNH endonuclease